MQGMLRTQPWPAVRIRELLAWASTDEAADLLAGKLPEAPAPEAPAPEQEGFLSRWSSAVADTGKSLMFWTGDEDADPAETEPGPDPTGTS